MKCIVEGPIRQGQPCGCGGTQSPPTEAEKVTTAITPLLFLDNRIDAVTGTSFCIPSGRWGGAKTDSLRR